MLLSGRDVQLSRTIIFAAPLWVPWSLPALVSLPRLVLHVLALKDSAVTARPGGIQGKGVEMQMYAKRATLSLSTRAWEAVPYFHSNSLGFPDTDDLLALSLTVPTADEVDALIEVLSRCRCVSAFPCFIVTAIKIYCFTARIEPWGMARPLDLRDSNQFELYK